MICPGRGRTGRGAERHAQGPHGRMADGAEGFAYAAALGTGVASLVLFLLLSTRVFDRLPEGPWRLLWPLLLAGVAFPSWGLRKEEPPIAGVPVLREPFDGWSLLPLLVGAFLVLSAMASEVAADAIDVH